MSGRPRVSPGPVVAVAAAAVLLAACATGPGGAAADAAPDAEAARSVDPAPRPSSDAAAAARTEPPLLSLETVSIGAPTIRFRSLDGEQADPRDSDGLSDLGRGTASWYGLQFHGRQTANGERYNMYELTAAHRTLPFGTVVRVRSLQDGRTVQVRINDRGPYVDGRVIDLSKAAADELGMVDQGVKPVSLTVTEWPDLDVGAAGKARRSPAAPKAAAAQGRDASSKKGKGRSE